MHRRDHVEVERLEHAPAMAEARFGEVVVVVAVDPAERADLDQRLPQQRAGLQQVEARAAAQHRDDVVVEAADVRRLAVDLDARADHRPHLRDARHAALVALHAAVDSDTRVERDLVATVVQQVEGRSDLRVDADATVEQAQQQTAADERVVVCVDERKARRCVVARRHVAGNLPVHIRVEIEPEERSDEPAHSQSRDEVRGLTPDEPRPTEPLEVDVRPYVAGDVTKLAARALGEHGIGSLPGGLEVPARFVHVALGAGHVAELHVDDLFVGAVDERPLEGELRFGEIALRSIAVSGVQEVS
jgi:hypothetical protein